MNFTCDEITFFQNDFYYTLFFSLQAFIFIYLILFDKLRISGGKLVYF